MRILVLGGTQFVGRHIVESLLRAGHAVSAFNRGRTPDELPADVERLRGDRDQGREGLGSLIGRSWDACVDVSGYLALQVRASAELLCCRVGHYVYLSAVSVYGDRRDGPIDETQPVVTPAPENVTQLDQETYGRLKVSSENIVREVFANRCTLLRPQIVAGPHDPFDRFSYWVRRAAQPGAMLAPGNGSDWLQVIDARDVARCVAHVCANRLTGTFNLAGPRLTWKDFIILLGARDVVWVRAELLADAALTECELPLFRPDGGPRSGLMNVDHRRARDAGLQLTATDRTIAAVREWLKGRDDLPALSREREADLIARMHSSPLPPTK